MEAEQQPAADQAAGNEPVAMEAEANAMEAAAPAPGKRSCVCLELWLGYKN